MKKVGNYYPELDSLRFVAFLLVLVHHNNLHSIPPKIIPVWETLANYGWLGVDLFLCLSAFLFARLLYVEHQEKGKINIGYFYLRRTLRIWPLYFFFFSIILALSIQENGWNSHMLNRSAGMVTFTDNLFSMSLGYNDSILLYSAHLWTISYEEQFYLIIPWVLRKFYKIKGLATIKILLVVTLIGMLIRAVFIYYKIEHPAIWVFPITHFESIFGGLIVGLGLFDKYLKKIPNLILFLTGIIALYLVTLLPNINIIQWNLMLTYPLIGIGTSLILFTVMQNKPGPISYLLRNKTLGYLGKISYGLYLYHLLGLEFAYNLTNTFVSQERLLVYPATGLLFGLAITIAISIVSYQFLEKPFLRLKERFTFIKSRPI